MIGIDKESLALIVEYLYTGSIILNPNHLQMLIIETMKISYKPYTYSAQIILILSLGKIELSFENVGLILASADFLMIPWIIER